MQGLKRQIQFRTSVFEMIGEQTCMLPAAGSLTLVLAHLRTFCAYDCSQARRC